jgi:protein-arginine kinase activator protein McsA
MTKQELDYIAEQIFNRILEKQTEYDKEFKDDLENMFIENVNGITKDTKTEHLLSELARLNTMLASYVESEQYEKANIIKRQIELTHNKLNNL